MNSKQSPKTDTPIASLPKTVIGLGWVSPLTDLSSEAMFPLLPIFMVGLGATTTFIGAVEGTAELVASVLKYYSGKYSDHVTKKKPLVLAGYGLSTLVRPLMALALSPWHVLAIRALDRVGKGVRTSPRDALILAATDVPTRARAYGFHRAMDHGGAALGSVFSLTFLYGLGADTAHPASGMLRTVFLWAAVPGVLAVVALWLTPEPNSNTSPPHSNSAGGKPRRERGGARIAVPAVGLLGTVKSDFARTLIPVLIFGFANATDAFLIVKSTAVGLRATYAPLLWLCLHLVKASLGSYGGRLADHYGRRTALVVGWTLYAVTWGAVGFAQTVLALFGVTIAYGVCHGLVEGAEKALIAETIPGGKAGRGFGIYNMSMGLVAIVSGGSFGFVWQTFGNRAAFVAWGALALIAALALMAAGPRGSAPHAASPA